MNIMTVQWLATPEINLPANRQKWIKVMSHGDGAAALTTTQRDSAPGVHRPCGRIWTRKFIDNSVT